MINVDEAQIVKMKTHGQSFEILVDADAALAFKAGSSADITDVVAVQKVFSDARKGMEASPLQMKQVFGSDDPMEVAKLIIKKGEVPLTKEHKERLREEKKRQIIAYIHRNAVDPRTHAPHPPARVEAALEEAHFHINEFDDVQHQVQEALKSIRQILPLRFEMKEIAIKIPAEYAAKSYGAVTSFGRKLREDWQGDGSWVVVMEIPGGLEEDFYAKVNSVCHGNMEAKVLQTR